MLAIDLSKQQALDADPKAILQINFTANLNRKGKTIMFFIPEEAKKNSLNVKLSNLQLNKLKPGTKK